MKTLRYLLVCLLCASTLATPATLLATPQQPATQSEKIITHPININTAGSQQLQTIPGIGIALAERIIQFRTEQGPFKSIEALTSVRGIGEKSVEKLRPWVTVK